MLPTMSLTDLSRHPTSALPTIKHVKGRHFRMTPSFATKSIQLRLADDGLGFKPKLEHDGYGLIGMEERVDPMDGQFILRFMPEQGTQILVILIPSD
jgi:signal transduction histidine kinase